MIRWWAVAGMVGLSPLLLFTLYAVLLALHAVLVASDSRDRWIENRSPEPIWVTPISVGGPGPLPLPHYQGRWPSYSPPPYGEVAVPSGETRRLVVDGYVESDEGPCGLVIRTEAGKRHLLRLGWDERVVVDDPRRLEPADPEMIAAANRPAPQVALGLPIWVVVTLGLVAPAVLVGLICCGRKKLA